jgi:hypothetical protein
MAREGVSSFKTRGKLVSSPLERKEAVVSELALVERLERVERENRRWKVIGIGIATLMGLALLMGAAKPRVQDEVRARRFTLVDSKGKLQGFLGFSALGSPTLFLFDNPTVTLFDSERRPRVQLAGGVVESGLRLYTKNGDPLADLYIESGEWPRLALYDKSQRRRVALQVLPTGSPELMLKEKDGKTIWSAP